MSEKIRRYLARFTSALPLLGHRVTWIAARELCSYASAWGVDGRMGIFNAKNSSDAVAEFRAAVEERAYINSGPAK